MWGGSLQCCPITQSTYWNIHKQLIQCWADLFSAVLAPSAHILIHINNKYSVVVLSLNWDLYRQCYLTTQRTYWNIHKQSIQCWADLFSVVLPPSAHIGIYITNKYSVVLIPSMLSFHPTHILEYTLTTSKLWG